MNIYEIWEKNPIVLTNGKKIPTDVIYTKDVITNRRQAFDHLSPLVQQILKTPG